MFKVIPIPKKNLKLYLDNFINDRVLLINIDEEHKIYKDKNLDILKNIMEKIEELNPYLIIVTSQNSLSRTEYHFQHLFGEELLEKKFSEENKNKYKRLSKVDATKPIHSTSISSTFSKIFKKDDPDPYNLRTRIYYRTDKICLNFEDEELSKKSCFTNKRNPLNEYKSIKEKECEFNNDNIIITNYYMRRYSSQEEVLSKKGYGTITIGLILKVNEERYYKLIISNRFENNNNNNSSYANFSEVFTNRINVNMKTNLRKSNKDIKSSIYVVSSKSVRPFYTDYITRRIQEKNDFKITVIQL